MNLENIILEKSDRIATITINRPKALNALNDATILDLKAAAENVRNDKEVDVIIITGAGGKAFVAGADITFMLNLNSMEARGFSLLGAQVFRTIETMEKPVIAAINGFCLGGGCELAMACDFRICTEKSIFGQPEVGLGITPGYSGTQRLPRLVGLGMAKQIIYTGDNIDAGEALRIGLVNKIVASEELMEKVKKMAKKISSRGQTAVRLSKVAINDGVQVDMDRGITIESDMFGLCFATEDQKEGMMAFAEKRKPNFSGK